jgi:tRNA(Ile)-lysidine synthase
MISPDPTQLLQRALVCERASPLLVALSGGLDSTVLLHALAQDAGVRANGLRAVHVEHGLHADAGAWAAHCIALGASLEVHIVHSSVSVDRDGGEGLEAAARKARYAAFEHTLMPGETLVTAHHRDDQAETFLLRALRGSGPDGLAAMRPWRDFATGRHWRPLLDIPRSALLAYARQHGLDWLEDPSNADTHHDRNFLRARIMPLLRERWPHADAAFQRSAQLSAEAVELLESEDAHALAMTRTADSQALSVPALHAIDTARRARILRRWIDELALPPLPREGVAHIESDLLHARIDASATFAWRDAVIHRWRDLLHAQRQRTPLDVDWQELWDGRQPLQLPNGDQLALVGAEALPAPVVVSARRGGERITLPGRTHSHVLKHVLQSLGIPPWERPQMPLLAERADGPLLAVGDLAYSASFDAWLRERGARLLWSQVS